MVLVETERAAPTTAGKNSVRRDWIRALEATAHIDACPQRIFPVIVEELARSRSGAPALLSAGESLNYSALAARQNRYARWALDQGLAKGDVVSLMMPNRPEYMAVWLGLSSVGVVVALINTQLRGPSLARCINIAAPRHVIIAAEFCATLRPVIPQLSNAPKIWTHGAGNTDFDRIDRAVERFSEMPLMRAERHATTIADRALLIYTSGTTGLPKAANISHRRLLQWSLWFAGLMNTGPDDRLYDCLPMYHSIGGVVATGALLVRGGSVLIRDKFSVNDFWDDVVEGDCTLFQYIGELCRYLINAPRHPRERTHRLRLCCGNGLRGEIWEKFQERFAIPRILEFYAATEGNVSLYNVEGKVGAIGRVPSFLAHRFPLSVVKFDVATGAPARDVNGFCIRCAIDKAGEAIGRIAGSSSSAGRDFEGYTSPADSEQKILRDVFERGDAWYRTGDLMRRDAGGFYYFVDRIGDTFRWKGENVATSEVAAAVAAFPGIREANVYGVHIPGAEGAAGMAAIVSDGEPNFDQLRQHMSRLLPSYARPKFLRLTPQLSATGTFKHNKIELQRDGYNPDATSDPIYFDDPGKNAFVRLDPALYARIQSGKLRF
ncbi:MAG TPA: long-chain-acyl-CoA synthetase [Xanthobacteraceae bacterium]|nr:long-chain-acyl-CoA synthetase [Xanthobacteraceae bacterium]